MRHKPDSSELLEAVRNFIREEAAPELRDRKAFLARVAVNALDIIARELQMGESHDAAEHERLSRLLGAEGPLIELNALLCNRIQEGEVAHDDPELIEHLRATALASLSIDQPKYSSYRAAVEGSVTGEKSSDKS